jgi:hypothetical protein
MKAPNSTVANTDLWSRYFQEQWGSRQSPTSEIADGTAARVAEFFTLVAAGPIAWLYNNRQEPAATDVVAAEPAAATTFDPSEMESVEDHAA